MFINKGKKDHLFNNETYNIQYIFNFEKKLQNDKRLFSFMKVH